MSVVSIHNFAAIKSKCQPQ